MTDIVKRTDGVLGKIQQAYAAQKISCMSDAEAVEITTTLVRYIGMDVGLKIDQSDSNAFTVVRVLDYIKKYYPQLTAPMVKHAFELLNVGKLDEYLPVDKNGNPDRNHYGLFSAQYFTKVVDAYLKWSEPIIEKEEVKALPAPTKPTDSELKRIREEWHAVMIDHYESVIKGGSPMITQFELDTLKKNGLEQVDEDEYYAEMVASESEDGGKTMQDLIQRVLDKQSHERVMRIKITEAKVKDIYRQIHMEGKHLRDYLKA